MSILIKHMAMPKGCIYANDKDQTEYCPLLNHDDVPFCQYIENEPESAIGIDKRPVYCPLSDVPEPCQDAVSRQAAIEAIKTSCFLVDAMEKVIKLPSAQPEQRWIPCSERLPEEKTAYYLVTIANHGRFFTTTLPDNVETVRWDYDRRKGKNSWHWCTERTVLAWMPLPEPYREEGD